ncbi:hypothetical protein MTR_6g011160 [Medicago truncatula]|uniref:Uncharacterized protein n=1 Tax=Medicago truncatula TaxID=3880 RepID=A0A072U769_MEDTR|nr:hypothetical protein MTR_6g011160 [Medicago truncatula]
MEIFMPLKEIRILCWTGNDLIIFKLLFGLWPKNTSLPTFVEANGEWAYLHFVLKDETIIHGLDFQQHRQAWHICYY